MLTPRGSQTETRGTVTAGKLSLPCSGSFNPALLVQLSHQEPALTLGLKAHDLSNPFLRPLSGQGRRRRGQKDLAGRGPNCFSTVASDSLICPVIKAGTWAGLHPARWGTSRGPRARSSIRRPPCPPLTAQQEAGDVQQALPLPSSLPSWM